MKIEEVFHKLRPLWGRQLDILWQEYLVADPPLRKVIEKTLRVALARRLGETFESENVLLKPPGPQLAAGPYHIGRIHYGKQDYYALGLREHEFIQHIGIFGRSGSGKTNLCYGILKQLVEAGKPFLIFDWKRNYRDLLVQRPFDDLLVFTVGRDVRPFRFNPLIPPAGTSPTVWLKKLVEIMCHAYFLGEGVAILLLRAIDALYRKYGVYRNATAACPTMADIRRWMRSYRAKGREAGWMESATRAVETLSFGEFGRVLNEGPFFDPGRLLDRRVVLELDALTNADKTFLIEAFLLWIHHYRLAQESRETFKHAIIIEEAHHVLLRKKQEATGEETVTDVLLREIRELGESIICLDQHPSLISKPALGNTYTTFAMNLKHRGDIAMIQDSLLLNSEQAGYLGRLEVGWGIVRLQGRWFWPFLVKVPLLTVDKGAVTDARLRRMTGQQQNSLSRLLYHSGGSSRVISTKDRSSGLGEAHTPSKQSNRLLDKEGNIQDRCTIGLTTNERQFLEDILQYPTSSMTQRYSRLGWSSRRGNALQKTLVDKQLAIAFDVVLPTSRNKALALTDRGRQALGLDSNTSYRFGGSEHRYWVERIAEHLRACGYTVEKEAPTDNGGFVDIVASRDGHTVAVEIETGNSDVRSNIEKCMAERFDDIIIATTSSAAHDAVTRMIGTRARGRVLRATEVVARKW